MKQSTHFRIQTKTRNITENDSLFVMVPYDQDRIVSAEKPAKVSSFTIKKY